MKQELTDQLEIHLLDLRKLPTDATLSPALRRWAEFFDHPTADTLERLAQEDEVMADTVEKLVKVSARDQEYYLAEARFQGEVRRRLELGAAREEGRAEARLDAILEILTARFGSVAESLRSDLETLGENELQQLVVRAAVATSLEDLASSSAK